MLIKIIMLTIGYLERHKEARRLIWPCKERRMRMWPIYQEKEDKMTQWGDKEENKTPGRGKKLTSSSKKLRRAIPPSGLVKVGGGSVCTVMESHGKIMQFCTSNLPWNLQLPVTTSIASKVVIVTTDKASCLKASSRKNVWSDLISSRWTVERIWQR